MVLEEHVLVLNKNWVPVDTCTVEVAFTKLFSGTAKFLEVDTYSLHSVESWLVLPVRKSDDVIRTAKMEIRVPDVMILRNAASPRRVMRWSRRNLLRRDNYTCQYCGSKNEPTIDHVMPRTRGGKSTWTNCVISCVACNSKKADRTPEEVGMSLLPRRDMMAAFPHDQKRWTTPYEPAWSPVFRVSPAKLKQSWLGFLPENMVKAHQAIG